MFDVCDVFVVFGEHEFVFAFAVGVVHPCCVVYIASDRFVWLLHIFMCYFSVCVVVWANVCTGGPVYGSNFAVMLSAFVRMVFACCGEKVPLGMSACIAPRAYGAPVPIA